MKKNIFGRQFKRDHNERKALFKGLMTALVMHERIETTEEKAKAIKGSVEKLVTKAIKQGVNAERLLLPYLHESAVKKMIADIAPRFSQRPGGYTRIIRFGRRFNDNASVVAIEWVERPVLLTSKEQAAKDKGKVKGQEVQATAQTSDAKAKKSAKPVKKQKTEEKKADTKTAKKTAKKEKTK